jgi:hypothetical protein
MLNAYFSGSQQARINRGAFAFWSFGPFAFVVVALILEALKCGSLVAVLSMTVKPL